MKNLYIGSIGRVISRPKGQGSIGMVVNGSLVISASAEPTETEVLLFENQFLLSRDYGHFIKIGANMRYITASCNYIGQEVVIEESLKECSIKEAVKSLRKKR